MTSAHSSTFQTESSATVSNRIGRGLVMVTRKLRHFKLAPGLTTENWFDTGTP